MTPAQAKELIGIAESITFLVPPAPSPSEPGGVLGPGLFRWGSTTAVAGRAAYLG